MSSLGPRQYNEGMNKYKCVRLFCKGSWWQKITLFISKYGWVANLGDIMEPLGREGGRLLDENKFKNQGV
jgi:hypothetical protein